MNKVIKVDAYVDWLKRRSAAHDGYWYGVIFQRATKSLYEQKKKQYPEHYTAERERQYEEDIQNGRFVADCVNGAVKGAIWTLLGTTAIKYRGYDCPDINADSMAKYCRATFTGGEIDTLPDAPGILLHKSGHVGVTIGNGKAVEWRGFKYGCVTTSIKSRGWTDWAYIPWVDYETENNIVEGGNDVKTYTATGNVWMREEPNANAAKVKVVNKGSKLENVDEMPDGWAHVKTADGKIGYCSTKYLEEN